MQKRWTPGDCGGNIVELTTWKNLSIYFGTPINAGSVGMGSTDGVFRPTETSHFFYPIIRPITKTCSKIWKKNTPGGFNPHTTHHPMCLSKTHQDAQEIQRPPKVGQTLHVWKVEVPSARPLWLLTIFHPLMGEPTNPGLTRLISQIAIWVCLKIGYIPNYSHLIGIMIINHWV
jgi:hypothetical protein